MMAYGSVGAPNAKAATLSPAVVCWMLGHVKTRSGVSARGTWYYCCKRHASEHKVWYQDPWMFGKCLITLRLWSVYSDQQAVGVWWMFNGFFGEWLVSVWRMFGECLMNVLWLSGGCLVSVWWMFDECLVNVWWMYGACMYGECMVSALSWVFCSLAQLNFLHTLVAHPMKSTN